MVKRGTLNVPWVCVARSDWNLDTDGDLDVVVVNLNELPSVLRNDVTGGGHWLKSKLVGTKVEPQRDQGIKRN